MKKLKKVKSVAKIVQKRDFCTRVLLIIGIIFTFLLGFVVVITSTGMKVPSLFGINLNTPFFGLSFLGSEATYWLVYSLFAIVLLGLQLFILLNGRSLLRKSATRWINFVLCFTMVGCCFVLFHLSAGSNVRGVGRSFFIHNAMVRFLVDSLRFFRNDCKLCYTLARDVSYFSTFLCFLSTFFILYFAFLTFGITLFTHTALVLFRNALFFICKTEKLLKYASGLNLWFAWVISFVSVIFGLLQLTHLAH